MFHNHAVAVRCPAFVTVIGLTRQFLFGRNAVGIEASSIKDSIRDAHLPSANVGLVEGRLSADPTLGLLSTMRLVLRISGWSICTARME